MADGEGEGDPRDSGKKCSAPEEFAEPRDDGDDRVSSASDVQYPSRSPVKWSSTENGTNGMYSDESMDGCHQEGPLDFSVKKNFSAIPVQNLYNKLANGLHRRGHEHKARAPRDYEGREDTPNPQEEVSNSDRNEPKHTLKTEAISPPPRLLNGMSPISDATLSRNSSANSPEVPRIGEPQIAMPGLLPGAGLPGGAAGLLPMFSAGLLPTSGLFNGLHLPPDTNGSSHEKTGKSARPFNSFHKDQMAFPPPFGALPALPQITGLDMIAAQAMASNSEEVFAQYKQYLMAIQDQLRAQRSPGGSSTSSSSQGTPRQSGSVSGMHSPTGSSLEGTPMPPTSGSTPFVMPTSPQTSNRPYVSRSGSGSRKRGLPLPDAMKDEAYWERRRKNNDAAKRSRDSRRAKEDHIALRAAFLEQENLKLRVEVTALKNETAKLRCMLYNS